MACSVITLERTINNQSDGALKAASVRGGEECGEWVAGWLGDGGGGAPSWRHRQDERNPSLTHKQTHSYPPRTRPLRLTLSVAGLTDLTQPCYHSEQQP